MTIKVVEYWPFGLIGTTKKRSFAYVDPTGTCPSFRSTFYYDNRANALICSDYDERDIWQDDWVMTYAPDRGVMEIADRYPRKNAWLARIFGPTQTQKLKSPILWGNVVNIGDMILSTPAYAFPSVLDPRHGSGFQAVHFEKLLKNWMSSGGVTYQNVLVFQYAQTWNGKTTGARYWMARDIGPVAIQWLGYDAKGGIVVEEPRCDAVVLTPTT